MKREVYKLAEMGLLIRQALDKDEDAKWQVYLHYSRRIVPYLLSNNVDWSDAQDIFNEVFDKVLSEPRFYDPR